MTFDTLPYHLPGAFFGPPNNIECPDAQMPDHNIVMDNPSLPNNGHNENGDGHGSFDQPNRRRREEREEELNYNYYQYLRAHSFLQQQLPPLSFGMDWRQQGAAVHFPVYYSQSITDPHEFPFVFSYAYPFFPPCAYPFVFPCAFPYANPYAFAYAPPYVPPYAYPYTFAYVPPYAPPHAAPYVPCYAAPPANPLAFLNVDPHGILEPLIARIQHERPEQGPGLDADGIDEDNGFEDPELEVFGLGFPETIGPLTTEECFKLFNGDSSQDDEDAVVPSTPGFSREESGNEETAAKKPRWSDEKDLE